MLQKSCLAMVILLLLCCAVRADDTELSRAEYVRANYAKFEYSIPMRDGVELFTAVYQPNDRSKKYPIVMMRTPYSIAPYGADQYKAWIGPDEAFEKEGFIFVFQDVRGRFMSEGEYIHMRPHISDKRNNRDIDESTDTYDTIEWLLNTIENHNGNVGQWGISYPGYYCSAGMIDTHPALKAVSPQAPIADWFWDDMHHHGAFILPMAFSFFSMLGPDREEPTSEWPEREERETPDSYQFFLDLGVMKNVNEKHFEGKVGFWNDIVEHPNYDKFWQSQNILPHLKNITAAVMVVGGWFDAEDLYGTFKTYSTIERQNPEIFNMMVIGPWPHGGWRAGSGKELGDASFGFNTGDYYRDNVLLKFFTHFLKDDESELELPEAIVFETGANRWRFFDTWPPEQTEIRNLYLQAESGLSFDTPGAGKNIVDSYISDPDKPVPYSLEITSFWPRNYMSEDQRHAARRPDVVVYQTDILEADMTLAGPLNANLFVSTSGTASDWIVKLIDVYPKKLQDGQKAKDAPELDAYQLLVRSEVLRGRFRESYEKPKPFVPDEITPLSFELQDVLHTFLRGHRIMIQIHSTWFPLIDRNPQKYVPNIFKADEDDFQTVTNRVYRSKEYPSHIEVGVLP